MSDLLLDTDDLTVDELIDTLKYIKSRVGGKTRVVFEEPFNFNICQIKGATFTMSSGSGTDIRTYEPDEDRPRNAKPTVVLYAYD